MHPDREPVVIAGLVGALLVASVAPFALPLVRTTPSDAAGTVGTPDPSETSNQGVGLTPPPGRVGRATTSTTSPTTTGTTPSPVIEVDCSAVDARTATGTPDVTGLDVDVAVIDPTGFAVDAAGLEDHVEATASFSREDDLGIRNGGHNGHGTASARVVTNVAPGASLHLANFRTALGFTRAIEWAVEQDVDVVVAPTVFYAKPNDGSSPVSRAVSRAAEAGIPVVVPTGNVAGRHWEGRYDGGGTVEFAPGDARMYLRGDADRVQAWLWWNETEDTTPDAFSVVLYRETDDGPERVAESSAYPRGPVGTNQVLTERVRTNNLLSEQVADGSYFLRVEGPPNETHQVELVVPTHRLEQPRHRGSVVAPATASQPGVVAVGAARRATGDVVPSSGRGPTSDGRAGVDVLGPSTATGDVRFTGTSAAASHVGGVVALLEAVRPSLSPAEVEAVLEAAARGDPAAVAGGAGMVDAGRALACAERGEADA